MEINDVNNTKMVKYVFNSWLCTEKQRSKLYNTNKNTIYVKVSLSTNYSTLQIYFQNEITSSDPRTAKQYRRLMEKPRKFSLLSFLRNEKNFFIYKYYFRQIGFLFARHILYLPEFIWCLAGNIGSINFEIGIYMVALYNIFRTGRLNSV